jgi:hypothetical protein
MTTVRDNTIRITVRNGRGADGANLGDVTLGTGVSTALAINVGQSGSLLVNGDVLGTPSSGTLTSCTGLPVSTGLTGAGTGVLTAAGTAVNTNGGFVTASTASIASGAILTGGGSGTAISAITPGTGISTFLATPSSANLKSAITDETGSGGALVFATGPTLTGPVLAAGSTSVAPLNFTSGTNLTTAAAGAMEYDGVFYTSPAASNRGLSPSKYFVYLTSANTLTNSTSAQPLFDGGGGPANGQLTLPVGKYAFECIIYASSLSASSNSLGFSLGGTATIASIIYLASGSKGTATVTKSKVATAVAVTAADTTQEACVFIRGSFNVSVTGTIIPQIQQNSNSAAATIDAGSCFICYPIGSSAYVGNWS